MSVEIIAEQKLHDYFRRLEQGQDVSPANRFRLEGYLQALVDQGLLAEDWLSECIEKCLPEFMDREFVLAGERHCWELPFQMVDAPVTRSTK